MIFSAGLVAFSNDFDMQLKIWLAWYGVAGQVSGSSVVCRSVFALGRAGCVIMAIQSAWSRWRGILAAGQMLMESFRNQPWLGFEVVGVYHDPKPGGVSNDWRAATAGRGC